MSMSLHALLGALIVSVSSGVANADSRDCYDAPSGNVETALLINARLGQTECVRELFNATYPVDFNAMDMEKQTVLSIAATLRGDKKQAGLEIAEMAIRKGVKIDAKDIYGDTALCNATYSSLDLTKILVENGADVNVTCQSGTPITHATKIETLQLLIDKGADVNKGTPVAQQTNWAIQNNEYNNRVFNEKDFQTDIARIKLLLDHGADIAPALKVALHFATLQGKPVEEYKTYQFLKAYKK